MSKEHAHKYLRVKLGAEKYIVFKCILPRCGHFIAKELVLGKPAMCWRCGREMVMTQKMTEYKKPHCPECTRVRKPKVEAAAVEKLADQLIEAKT